MLELVYWNSKINAHHFNSGQPCLWKINTFGASVTTAEGLLFFSPLLKVRASDVWSKLFAAQGEAGSGRFPPEWMGTVLRVRFMMRMCLGLSYPFWRGCFLSCTMCRSHSTSFRIFSERIALCEAAYQCVNGRRKVRSHTDSLVSFCLLCNF